MAGDRTQVLEDDKASHTPPPADLSTIDSRSPFLIPSLRAKAPQQRKETNVSRCPSAEHCVAEHLCDKPPEHRGRCPSRQPGTNFSSFSDLSVPSVPQPHGTTARISAAKFAPAIYPLVFAPGHSGPVPPRSPTPGPIPILGPPFPAPTGSAPGQAAGHAAPRSRRLPLGCCLLTSRDNPAPGPAPPEAPPRARPFPLAPPSGPASLPEKAGGFATILTWNQPLGDSARGSPPRLRSTEEGMLLLCA